MDLTAQTPAEIDALWLGHLQAIAKLQHFIQGEQHNLNSRYASAQSKAQSEIAIENYLDQISDISQLIAPLGEEFYRRGHWSRFYVVTNVNGHIHSSRECSTCFPTTQYAWITALSGASEEELVAQYGEAACTICYPSAPTYKGFEDGTSQLARFSQAEKDARAAEKATRAAAKAAKTLEPELQFKDLGYSAWTITTVAAAKQALRDAYCTENGFRYQTDRAGAPRVIEAAERALLAKLITPEEIATIKARALKKAQKEGF